jgi:hypothetical protein
MFQNKITFYDIFLGIILLCFNTSSVLLIVSTTPLNLINFYINFFFFYSFIFLLFFNTVYIETIVHESIGLQNNGLIWEIKKKNQNIYWPTDCIYDLYIIFFLKPTQHSLNFVAILTLFYIFINYLKILIIFFFLSRFFFIQFLIIKICAAYVWKFNTEFVLKTEKENNVFLSYPQFLIFLFIKLPKFYSFLIVYGYLKKTIKFKKEAGYFLWIMILIKVFGISLFLLNFFFKVFECVNAAIDQTNWGSKNMLAYPFIFYYKLKHYIIFFTLSDFSFFLLYLNQAKIIVKHGVISVNGGETQFLKELFKTNIFISKDFTWWVQTGFKKHPSLPVDDLLNAQQEKWIRSTTFSHSNTIASRHFKKKKENVEEYFKMKEEKEGQNVKIILGQQDKLTPSLKPQYTYATIAQTELFSQLPSHIFMTGNGLNSQYSLAMHSMWHYWQNQACMVKTLYQKEEFLFLEAGWQTKATFRDAVDYLKVDKFFISQLETEIINSKWFLQSTAAKQLKNDPLYLNISSTTLQDEYLFNYVENCFNEFIQFSAENKAHLFAEVLCELNSYKGDFLQLKDNLLKDFK